MAESAVSIQDLRKVYPGGVVALESVHLELPRGSFFGLLGPNGAGKSTLIHILTGLCNPSSGRVSIFGFDLKTQYRDCRRRVGLAPQEFNFDRFFSIEKILEFQGGYFGIEPRVLRRRIDEFLQRFDLWDKRKQKASELSGGMKRRLILIKALVHDPDLLILDEPTAGMDVSLRHEFWNFLRELNATGKTILLTTHYLEEAEKLCHEIAMIRSGRILRQAPTAEFTKDKTLEESFIEFLEKPTSEFQL